jgi:hypothetical protein
MPKHSSEKPRTHAGFSFGMSALETRSVMNTSRWQAFRSLREQSGKVGWILLWLLGVPIPILFVLFLLRGCT